MRLSLVISSLGSGGAERVMASLADYWVEQGHHITLITLNPSVPDFYRVSPKIERVQLQVRTAPSGPARLLARMKMLIALRRALVGSTPEVVLSFMDLTNILTLFATRTMGVPVVISERTNPRAARLTRAQRLLRRFTYRCASALVVQTAPVADWASSIVRRTRVHVIPNPVRPPRIAANSSHRATPPEPFVLTVGRLEPEKGFDVLIKAFALTLITAPEWRLLIVGKGPQEASLKRLAEELGVAGKVQFTGTVREVDSLYQQGRFFVLSSRVEGFPNALLEAMAAGMPVIATDCSYGPGEIITKGIDGILVPPDDIGAIHEAMKRLITEPELAARFSREATSVTTRFSLQAIGDQWEELFTSLLRTHAR